MLLATGMAVCAALGFGGMMMVLEGRTPPAQPRERSGVAQKQAPSTRCELTFPTRICTAYPQFSGIDERNVYVDDYQGSGANEAKCLDRARGFYDWCKFDRVVTARFYSNGAVVGVQSWPK